MEVKHRNHYVPQLYLKRWATNGRIPTYRLLVPHASCALWRSQSAKGLAFHQHLYTETIGGASADEFERWLDAEFEAPAEASIARATSGARLSTDDWRVLVRFAFAQDIRTPARMRAFLARQSEEMPKLLDDVVQNAVEKMKDDGYHLSSAEATTSHANKKDFPLKVLVESGENAEGNQLRVETVVGRKMWIWSLRHFLTQTIAQVPMTGWSIRRAAPGHTWPTSDNPLIRLNFYGPGNYNFEGGWKVPRGDLILPLGPTHLLHSCIGQRSVMRDKPLDVATTRLIRRLIIEHADRFVFAHSEEDIHDVRSRTVSSEIFREEREAWSRWHEEQSLAELDH